MTIVFVSYDFSERNIVRKVPTLDRRDLRVQRCNSAFSTIARVSSSKFSRLDRANEFVTYRVANGVAWTRLRRDAVERGQSQTERTCVRFHRTFFTLLFFFFFFFFLLIPVET